MALSLGSFESCHGGIGNTLWFLEKSLVAFAVRKFKDVEQTHVLRVDV